MNVEARRIIVPAETRLTDISGCNTMVTVNIVFLFIQSLAVVATSHVATPAMIGNRPLEVSI